MNTFFFFVLVGILFLFLGNYYILVAEDLKQQNKRTKIFYFGFLVYLLLFLIV
jgi:hypothetical protein